MQPISVALAAALRWQPQEPNRRDELRDRAWCSRRQELLANLHGKLTAFQSFALGGIAGSIVEMITMPAVAVRTRLMVQGASATDATQYRGFFDACQTMLRSEGIGAFYKGDGLLGSLNADTWPGGLGSHTTHNALRILCLT